eukprot:TRINITY_DN13155_c0_g1_i1.p1 TRINITY_DN13155_c0_g1~~TRINITY_DN13155_c0_g1_i1.p1  ORF type:complete len:410 (+),score=80.30 TRINITY_DN13155_c0_g1_i1:81-1310(+)
MSVNSRMLFEFDDDNVDYSMRKEISRPRSFSMQGGYDEDDVSSSTQIWGSYDLFRGGIDEDRDYYNPIGNIRPTSLPDSESLKQYVGLPSMSYEENDSYSYQSNDRSSESSRPFSWDQSSQEDQMPGMMGRVDFLDVDPIFPVPRGRSHSFAGFTQIKTQKKKRDPHPRTPTFVFPSSPVSERYFSNDHYSYNEESSSQRDYFPNIYQNISPAPIPHGPVPPLYRRNTADQVHVPINVRRTHVKEREVINRGRVKNQRRKKNENSMYTINLGMVLEGRDRRTSLMIKNIPNKYDQELLLEAIDQNFSRQYDFFYLPMDFKNHCNVGYAFINFISYTSIPKFYQEFNDTRWPKFKSVKVCEIRYGRIQGKEQLLEHFKSSRLMNEESTYRPVSFYSDGPDQGLPEPFPLI